MKKILEALHGARKIEWFMLIAAAALLVMAQFGRIDSQSAQYTEEERRLASILSRIDGVGRVEVMLPEDGSKGALIVAEGADRIDVCLRIEYAVHAVTGTAISSIEILPYER